MEQLFLFLHRPNAIFPHALRFDYVIMQKF